jgi:uncharacterized membrane protein YwzB
MIPILQIESLAITGIVFILSLVLTLVMTSSYLKGRKTGVLFWSLGMWSFTFGVLLEILFALGISPEPLIALYLFIVAILVEFLALGSMQLVQSKRIKQLYYAFCIITTAFVGYSLVATRVTNFIVNYIAYGNPPLLVIYSSSIVTFPAAAILIMVALKSYLKTKSYRMLSIIVGVVIVSIAGTLYIVQFPSLLYAAEFIGILLLWVGFYSRPKK